ncbi:MAG TPA: peptidylprolyl isomerase [Terriglobales bacterium]|nr:peptidylprolyl isomerase [Terriglobales bacterium]
MTNKFLGFVLSVSLSTIAAAQAPAPQQASEPQSMFKGATITPKGKAVVRINGTVLTDRDLLREMMTIFPYARQHGGKFPQSMEADIRRGALDMLEFEELVYQEAQRRNMNVTPARLDRAIKAFRDQFSSANEFRSYLKAECGGSMVKLREKVRRSLMIDDLLMVEITQKASVSDVQVQAYYQKNTAKFYSPESVSIQTISLVIPDHADAQQESSVRKRADDALRQARKARNYEDFGMLAEKFSEDDWRVMMGDHQSVTRDKMPPEVAKITFTLKPGEVSDLIRAENSWCIVRLNSHEQPRQTAFDQVKVPLKQELVANQVESLRRALHQQLRKKARVEEL